jgi:hypothetical protein
VVVRHLLRVCLLSLTVLALAACGGSGSSAPATTAEPQDAATEDPLAGVPDHDLFASNIKYELIDALINRGASAPVVDDVSCTWTSDTVADCTTTGYDNDEANSQCGYALLPCGNFRADVHAECSDAQGHDCTVEVDAEQSGG